MSYPSSIYVESQTIHTDECAVCSVVEEDCKHNWLFCASMMDGSAYYTCENCPMSHLIKDGQTTYFYNHKKMRNETQNHVYSAVIKETK